MKSDDSNQISDKFLISNFGMKLSCLSSGPVKMFPWFSFHNFRISERNHFKFLIKSSWKVAVLFTKQFSVQKMFLLLCFTEWSVETNFQSFCCFGNIPQKKTVVHFDLTFACAMSIISWKNFQYLVNHSNPSLFYFDHNNLWSCETNRQFLLTIFLFYFSLAQSFFYILPILLFLVFLFFSFI